MTIIEQFDLIESLVLKQAPPTEIRGHIIAIREELEAYFEKSKYLSALEAKNEDLIVTIAKLQSPNEEEARWNKLAQEQDRLNREMNRFSPPSPPVA